MRAKSDNLAQTAHHEAGHAVAAFYQGIRIRHVTIVPTKDALGHVKNHKVLWATNGMFDDSPRGVDRAERHIICLFAGPIAQRKFRRASRWRRAGGQDFPAATELLVRICDEDDECQRLYSKLLWRRAELLVKFYWKDIKAVARELLKRRTLKGNDVVEAINRAHGI
jgi:hypothetical protein